MRVPARTRPSRSRTWTTTPWYGSTRAATYGDDGWSNFLNAAFLWDGPETVAAGVTRRFGFRVVVHDGVWDADRCASYA